MINSRNIKSQQDILKSMLKEEKVFYYVTNDQGLFVSNNEYLAYVMPEEDFKVSLNYNHQWPMFLRFADDYKKAPVLRETNVIVKKGKKRYQEFDGGTFEVYVDLKLFKLFGQGEFTYRGNGPQSAVFIEENGELIGLVMPVRVKDLNGGE